jgi:glycosyltransferase involved in cell wall biosynthesis
VDLENHRPSDEIEASEPSRLTTKPLVSVLMVTYNHANYLAEAIQGVVSQKSDFPFELIIGEDASTDDTRSIALEYQRRYPEIVRVVYSSANVGMNANGKRIFAKARGAFIAFCEGDDYWRVPHKLARQIELISADEGIGAVHTDWVRAKQENGTWKFDLSKSVHRNVPLHFLEGDIFPTMHYPKILRTCTLLLRREIIVSSINSGLAKREYRFSDTVLTAYLTSLWRVAYLAEVTAVYRESPNSALRSGARSRVAFYKSCLEFDSDAREYFAGRANYAAGYRWDSSVGLLIWSLRARDGKSAMLAVRDIWKNFGIIEFFVTGAKTVYLRLPLRRKGS